MFRKRTTRERLWEVLPGLQFWTVFFGAIFLSLFKPVWAALFIICFDLYWVLKAINVATHLIAAYRKFRVVVTVDWLAEVRRLNNFALFADFLQQQAAADSNGRKKKFFAEEINKIRELMVAGKTGADYLD